MKILVASSLAAIFASASIVSGETCVTKTLDRPLPNATEFVLRHADVPSPRFPGFWQEGRLNGFFYRIWSTEEAVLQSDRTSPSWVIAVLCEEDGSSCKQTVEGSPTAAALRAAGGLEQCLLDASFTGLKVEEPAEAPAPEAPVEKAAPEPVVEQPAPEAPVEKGAPEPVVEQPAPVAAEDTDSQPPIEPPTPEVPLDPLEPKNVAEQGGAEGSQSVETAEDIASQPPIEPPEPEAPVDPLQPIEPEAPIAPEAPIEPSVPVVPEAPSTVVETPDPEPVEEPAAAEVEAEVVAEESGPEITAEPLPPVEEEPPLPPCGLASIPEGSVGLTLQRLLVEAGADPGTLDGLVGPRTYRALVGVLGAEAANLGQPEAITELDRYLCNEGR